LCVVQVLIKEEFDEKLSEFEEILQKVASDMAGGVLSEKFPPSELLKKTEQYVNRLSDLATKSEELMLVLKPEKTYTIKSLCKNLTQTLTTFKNILIQNTSDPLANSRLAFEQLRKALTDGSDFLFLMRDVKDNPSPLISAVLTFKKASETKASVISIQASEEFQPLIKYVLSRIDDFRVALMGLEKKIGEMKQIMRELQEESLKMLSDKTSKQSETTENKTENKQLSLSNFKAEENLEGKQHDND
jgi:sugar-specific transcriptional regulator TrmB